MAEVPLGERAFDPTTQQPANDVVASVKVSSGFYDWSAEIDDPQLINGIYGLPEIVDLLGGTLDAIGRLLTE